jgi:hypothetical protein
MLGPRPYYLETPRGFDRLLPLREVHVLLCVSVVSFHLGRVMFFCLECCQAISTGMELDVKIV